MPVVLNILVFMFMYSIRFCSTNNTKSEVNMSEIIKNSGKIETSINRVTLLSDDNGAHYSVKNRSPNTRVRVKRSGENKFVDLTKSTPMKLLRLFLQMFKNLVVGNGNDIGGAHPMSHKAPKGIVLLFKGVIVKFFFPDIGTESPTGLDKK